MSKCKLIVSKKIERDKQLEKFLKSKKEEGFNLDDSFIIYLNSRKKLPLELREDILKDAEDEAKLLEYTNFLLFNNFNGKNIVDKEQFDGGERFNIDNLENIQSVVYVSSGISCLYWIIQGYLIKYDKLNDTYWKMSYNTILNLKDVDNHIKDLHDIINEDSLEEVEMVYYKTLLITLKDIKEKSKQYLEFLKK